MKTNSTHLDEREFYYEKLRAQLEWHFHGVLYQLPFKSVLDFGAGTAISPKVCLHEGVETLVAVDSNRRLLEMLLEIYHDDRIRIIEDRTENVDLSATQYELALFMLSLPWLDNPIASLEKALSGSPEYILISEPQISSKERNSTDWQLPEYQKEILDILRKYSRKEINIDRMMLAEDYYPLVVNRCAVMNPRFTLRTVLYTKQEPDRIAYEKSKYIFQVNSICKNNCPGCYVLKDGKTLDEGKYLEFLQDVNPGDVVTFRGGEPTLTENFLDDFLKSALDMGAHAILESNAAFIGAAEYDKYLETLSDQNMEVRISVDKHHVHDLSADVRQAKFNSIATFIEDAKQRNIGWGLYALGMHRRQTERFLKETALEPYIEYIRPLTKYSHIEDLPLKGKYVDVEGRVHENLVGIRPAV